LVGIKIARAHDASGIDNISVYYRSDDTGSWNCERAYLKI